MTPAAVRAALLAAARCALASGVLPAAVVRVVGEVAVELAREHGAEVYVGREPGLVGKTRLRRGPIVVVTGGTRRVA